MIDAEDPVEYVDAREVVYSQNSAPLVTVFYPAKALALSSLLVAFEGHPLDLPILREDDDDVSLVQLEGQTSDKDPRRVGILLVPRG